MKFVSTRGQAPALSFEGALLAALARDGGLYMPEAWPKLSPDGIAGLMGLDYADAAYRVMRPYLEGDPCLADLEPVLEEAYGSFHHPAVAPLRQIAPNSFILELFHGPTLAFKDVAMQLLARLMDHVLRTRRKRVTIVGATSGDTGGAAIEAFRDRDNVDVFILFPEGRVSPFQRRQMTTTGASNVHAIAIEGTFDDCQAIVKGLFNNAGFRERVGLAGVNSINWARIVAQIVYYVTAAVALGAPHRAVSFTVPTGNFGDIFAGFAAKRMGLPIDRLVVATNLNDILTRTLASGRYELRKVTPTASPSMDIQVSSNFERLLFEAHQRDGAAVRRLMQDLAASGSFAIAAAPLARIQADFAAARADEEETAASIGETMRTTGFLPDPHTAVGLSVARRFAKPDIPMITLATAHPAKFAAAVERAAGRPAPLPAGIDDLMALNEDYAVLAKDRVAVEEFIAARARALAEKV